MKISHSLSDNCRSAAKDCIRLSKKVHERDIDFSALYEHKEMELYRVESLLAVMSSLLFEVADFIDDNIRIQ